MKLNYKKTIFCLQCLIVVLSCSFGLIGLVLRAVSDFSNEFEGGKQARFRPEAESFSVVRSSADTYNYRSFINGSSRFFGSVMSELACRVLTRHITSSNILVVTPSAVFEAKELEFIKTEQIHTNNTDIFRSRSVGGAFLQYGMFEGHTIHAISNRNRGNKELKTDKFLPTLDAWWRSFEKSGKNSNNASEWCWSTKPFEKPKWILLAVFDSDFDSENSVWQEAESFLEDCTVTYIVMAIHSVKSKNGSYEFGGMDAIESLLLRKYKLQVLSSSHYYANKNNERYVFERYGPNALFQSSKEIEKFLRWGADAAHRYMYGNSKDDLFTSYIFATQGLDLAIPAPQVYFQGGVKAIDVLNKYEMENLPPLKSCLKANGQKQLDFVFNETSLHLNLSKNKSIEFSQDELDQESNNQFLLWMNGKSLSQSEAVCIKHKNGSSKCNTRISKKKFSEVNSSGNSTRPNVLLILLDPISRSHFDRSMPKTSDVLTELNFIRFKRYTAVGPNSGPNQAALYSGTKLQKRNQLHKNLHSKDTWLWDRLLAAGYVTLKGEDGCIENSNMIQSLAPNTSHGSALQGLFCFNAFSRPNCIGPDLASSILFEYGYQFISTYEKTRKSINHDLRWASFMHFVDSHEDTMLLSATLDPGLSKFLRKLYAEAYFEKSVVIVASDHGLHYGPNFASWQGRKEATEPILYVHIPESLRHMVDTNVLKSNSHLWTTPFDLHETILELTHTSSNRNGSRRRGFTLTEHLPASRHSCEATSDLIPLEYCSFQTNEIQEDNSYDFCNNTPLQKPTISSFFSDISPLNRRPLMNFDADCHGEKRDLTELSKFELCNQK